MEQQIGMLQLFPWVPGFCIDLELPEAVGYLFLLVPVTKTASGTWKVFKDDLCVFEAHHMLFNKLGNNLQMDHQIATKVSISPDPQVHFWSFLQVDLK